MKLDKFIILFIISLTLIGSSCQKTRLESQSINVVTSNNSSNKENFRCIISMAKLTDEQIEQIGLAHNQHLEALLTTCLSSTIHFNSSTDFRNFIVNYQMQGMENLYSETTNEQRTEALRQTINNSVELTNQESYYESRIHDILETDGNYSDLLVSFNSLDDEIKQNTNLSNMEYNLCLAMNSVAKKSSYFWLPTSKGGSGVGNNLVDQLCLKETVIWSGPHGGFFDRPRTRIENDVLGAVEGGIFWSVATVWTGAGTVAGFAWGCVSGAIGGSALRPVQPEVYLEIQNL